MFVNHSSKEVTAKIVYYGPGLSGKTSNLQYIFSVTNPKTRGELISVETEIERTLFFDLLPINVGLIKGYQTKFQLYTVPGQVFYDGTRKLVLKGADGVVFVADSQELMKTANLESLENLKKNLTANNLDFNNIPLVFQFNKRDLGNILSLEELNHLVNQKMNRPTFGAVATQGTGVIETLRAISGLILQRIKVLLDHTEPKTDKAPTVTFDTDKKHKIIEREALPIKKIQVEDLEAVQTQMEEVKPDPVSTRHPSSFKGKEKAAEKKKQEEKDEDEWLTVETMEEFRDLEELVLGEDMMQIDEVPDLAELVVDEENIAAKPPAKEAPQENPIAAPPPPEVQTPEREQPPLLDIDTFDLSELEQDQPELIDELPDLAGIHFDEEEHKQNETPTNLSIGEPEIILKSHPDDDTNPFPQLDLEDVLEQNLEHDTTVHNQPPLAPPPMPATKPGTELPPVVKVPTRPKKEALHPIDELKQSLVTQKHEKPVAKTKSTEPMGLDLFERLKDKSRVTVIRDLPSCDSHFVIEIRDKDARLLDIVNVVITPETKKVNLILDVKR